MSARRIGAAWMGALGRVGYGALFVVVLPALLVLWSRATTWISAPIPSEPWHRAAAWVALVAGGVLMVSSMAALWFRGGGLPMNAFPPPRRVVDNVYAIHRHPIYLGAGLVAWGIAVLSRSASALYLVVPTFVLAAVALVLGFEGIDLAERFGPPHPVFLEWPRTTTPDAAPTLRQRAQFYAVVLLPWMFGYGMFTALGRPPDAVSLRTSIEETWPVLPWTEPVYASLYLAVLAAPWWSRTQRDLRELCVNGTLCSVVGFYAYLVLPIVAPPLPLLGARATGFWAEVLRDERAFDTEACAFPSFHTIWAILAARALASRVGRPALLYALAVAISCVTTGQHAVADVAAGALVVWAVSGRAVIWSRIRAVGEHVANSFRTFEFGPVRVMSHAPYGGASTFLGVWLALSISAAHETRAVLLAGLGSMLGALLWAQWIEGASGLSRPYGFYGGLLGLAGGSLAAPYLGGHTWAVLGAYAVAAPVIQATGRLRCMVQGCCHGAGCSTSDPAQLEKAATYGIRYHNPLSRVVRFSRLAGTYVHPTQIWSILWNAAIFPWMVRAFALQAPWSFLAGQYLILNGAGRFVEEAYRGEPQTPRWGRLRAYQWAAIASMVIGAAFTALPSARAGGARWDATALLYAAAFGVVTALASGVDFPRSARRFSRLL